MNHFKKIFILLAALTPVLYAGSDHAVVHQKGSPEFERIKDLAGIWQGTSKHGKKTEETTVLYQVTSGGQAVTETLSPGTPHEMISVYYDQGGKLTMTHYCMLPNRPVLEVKKSTPKALELDLAASNTIGPQEHHMRSLSITWKGPDKLTQKWTSWKEGKPSDTATIALTRVK
jgi:hypothetical protein